MFVLKIVGLTVGLWFAYVVLASALSIQTAPTGPQKFVQLQKAVNVQGDVTGIPNTYNPQR